jgi:hypothetical protein
MEVQEGEVEVEVAGVVEGERPPPEPPPLPDGPRARFGVDRLGELRDLLGEPEDVEDVVEQPVAGGEARDVPYATWLERSVGERLEAKERRKQAAAAVMAARPPVPATFEGLADAFDMPLEHVHMAFWFEKGEVPGSNFGIKGNVPVIPKLLERWAKEAHFAVPMEGDLPREPRRRDPTAAAMDDLTMPTCPKTTAPEPIKEVPLRHPRGLTTFPIEHLVTDVAKCRDLREQVVLKRFAKKDAQAAASPGHLTQPAARWDLTSEHLADWHCFDAHFDISDLDAVFQRKVADVPVTTLDLDPLHRIINPSGKSEAEGGTPIPDAAIMYETKYGWRFNSDREYMLMAKGPARAATVRIYDVRRQMEEDAEWYDSAQSFRYFPGAVNPLGLVHKNLKWRGTTNLSYPPDKLGPTGKPISVNGGCDLSDAVMHATLEWTAMKHFRHDAEVVYAAWRLVAAADPEAAKHLRPVAFADDNTAYYRQFHVARRDRGLQSIMITHAGLELPTVYNTNRAAFGGAPICNRAQRFGMVDSLAIWCEYVIWEDTICRLSRAGDPVARLIAPPSYLQLVEARRLKWGRRAMYPLCSGKYVDDRGVVALGTVRSMKVGNIVWRVAWLTKTGLATGKLKWGEIVTLLGLDFWAAVGALTIPEDKDEHYDSWIERIVTLQRVEKEEMDSALGSFNFGAEAVGGGRKFLSRSFRQVNLKRIWRKDGARGLTTRNSDVFRRDLLGFKAQKDAARGVHFFCEEPLLALSDPRVTVGRTDANRVKRGFCGMGGVAYIDGVAYYWMLRFSMRVIEILPVHILEFMAYLTQVNVIPALHDTDYMAFVDNMAVVYVLQLQKARDSRFQELLLLDADVVEERRLVVDTRHVPTKENESDDLSRGREEEFREEMGRRGYGGDRLVKVEVALEDYEALCERMIEITLRMPSNTRSVDRHTPDHF